MKRILLLAVSVIVTLLIAEIALRFIYSVDDKYYIWQPNLRHTFYPDSTLFYGIKGAKQFSINATGTRGDVFSANTKNYVCLGGSAIECLYLDDSEAWPQQLQYTLGSSYAIGSLGKSGVTTREHYLHIKYTVKNLEHVNGVVLMAGLNDLMKRLSRDSSYDADFTFTNAVEDSLVNTIFLKTGRMQAKTWWRRTALFNLVQRVYHNSKQKGVKWDSIQDDTGSTLQQWREHRKKSTAIIDTLPDLSTALNEYERNLELIYEEAVQQHLKLVCVSQAAIYKDSLSDFGNGLLWMGGIGSFQTEAGHAYYSPSALRKGLDMYNERLKTFCKAKGILFLDAGRDLPRDTSVFYDDCHFNEKGAHLLSRYIAEGINKTK